jgi:hypothetical protein
MVPLWQFLIDVSTESSFPSYDTCVQGKESWETTCWSEGRKVVAASPTACFLCVIIARGHMTRRCADGVLNLGCGDTT